MKSENVQTLVLRSPEGSAVAHLIAEVPEGKGRTAARLLKSLSPSFGLEGKETTCVSLGFSFAGLEATGVPDSYLQLFRRLAQAFEIGAVRRSVLLGDSGASEPLKWPMAFRQNRGHVVVSWHGSKEAVHKRANEFADIWYATFRDTPAATRPTMFVGARLGHPPDKEGEWVHFGYRDGLSEICIDEENPRPTAPDCRKHAAGALLLGHINDAGSNPFALSRAPEKVRTFFRDSSFGVLRPMAQNLTSFDRQIAQFVDALSPNVAFQVTPEFVKAKLCGRWPDGSQLRPGDLKGHDSLALDLKGDDAGEGCPFGSHVRRMRAEPDRNGNSFARPLQRRSIPFGTPSWLEPHDGEPRGLLGHFFCASIEEQFEHLLGQWAARPPSGPAPEDLALDPFLGPHEDADAALAVPLKGYRPQQLKGFRACTSTIGTMYAWYPSLSGLDALLSDDFVAEENTGPWLL